MNFRLYVWGLLLFFGFFLLIEPKEVTAQILLSPANGAIMDNGCADRSNGITWNFDWSNVPGASRYHIRVWRNPNLPVVNNMNVIPSSYNHNSPKTFIINSNSTGWRWMVRAKVKGIWRPWSAVRNFRVERLNTDCP